MDTNRVPAPDAAQHPGLRRARLQGLVVGALAAVLAGVAHADTVQVKGDTLRGHVVDLSADGVTFEPVYGSGSIVVPFADLQDVRTDAPMVVMYGEQGEAHGRLLGFEDGRILVGDDPASAQRIEAKTLFGAYPEEQFDGSTYRELHSRYRHWSASLDAGFGFTDSTTDNSSAFTAIRLERKKSPTRILFEGNFRYATEKQKGEPRTLTENVVTGLLRGEYDLTERLFGYASTRATYDEDKSLALRLEPRGGAGVRIFDRDDMTLSTDLGAAWIYEDYFGRSTTGIVVNAGPPQLFLTQNRKADNFWALAFGSDFMRKLPLGAIFRASVDYLPAVDDWTGDYLLRGDASLEIPLVDWLAFKIRALDEYDNTPAEGSDRNRATLTGLLSVTF